MQLKFVITGGPGTGKTTLIQELEKLNYTCTPEISRQVTLMARKKGIEYLFLKDPLLFSELLLEGREKQYLEAVNSDAQIVFFDRGIPDVHAYLDHFNTTYPDTYIKKSNLYRYDEIFILPPWKDIYKNDQERFETYESSISIYNHLKEAYSLLDYNVVEVPHGKVQERTDFILKHLKFL